MSNLRRWSTNGWTSAKGCTRGNYKRQSVNFSHFSITNSSSRWARSNRSMLKSVREIILERTSHEEMRDYLRHQFIYVLYRFRLTKFTGFTVTKIFNVKYRSCHYFRNMLQNINNSDELFKISKYLLLRNLSY